MSKIRETPISVCEKKFVLKCTSQHMRVDGRAFDEFRELKIEFGKDWGCCHVTLGKTSVLAQVSCEVQQPKSSRPNEGILNVNLELSQLGAPNFEAARQTDTSIQLNRLLEKCLKDSKAVDLESLCIKLNEKVWAFRVDVNVLNYEGNILDCASVAALAALAHFRRPDITTDGEEIIVHTYAQKDPIPTSIHHYPVCVSYGIFCNGEVILADPTLLEEGVAEGQLIYSLNAYKELCGLHLGGNVLMDVDQILSTTTKATNRANLVIQQIKDEIKKDAELRIEKKVKGFEMLLEINDEFDKLILTEDNWTSSTNRKNWKKRVESDIKAKTSTMIAEDSNAEEDESKTKIDDTKSKVDDSITKVEGHIQSISKGSAVLIPTVEDECIHWKESSEDENQDSDASVQEIIDKSAKEVITLDSDESEEDVVMILNADLKTNKKNKFVK